MSRDQARRIESQSQIKPCIAKIRMPKFFAACAKIGTVTELVRQRSQPYSNPEQKCQKSGVTCRKEKRTASNSIAPELPMTLRANPVYMNPRINSSSVTGATTRIDSKYTGSRFVTGETNQELVEFPIASCTSKRQVALVMPNRTWSRVGTVRPK